MPVWFEGSQDLACTLDHVKQEVADPARYFLGVVRLMPGLTSVELVEQGDGFVHIRTNEGMMRRTEVTKVVEAERVMVEFDEVYDAGSKITVKSHYMEEFTATGTGVKHRTVIRGVEAPGFLGFFYRNLGSSSIGKAVLKSHKDHLEGVGSAKDE